MNPHVFTARVLATVAAIPSGEVMTYKEVAAKSGYPGAARAVGSVMRKNTDYAKVPCHRVVRTGGAIGKYNRGGTRAKIARLKDEGVVVERGRVIVTKKGRYL